MSDYFSDRENGPRARTEQVITPVVWAGLVGTVSTDGENRQRAQVHLPRVPGLGANPWNPPHPHRAGSTLAERLHRELQRQVQG